MDGDPHGFQIFANYKFGSKNMGYLNHYLAIPTIEFIGLDPCTWAQLQIDYTQLIRLKPGDVKKAFELLENPHLSVDIKRQLQRLIRMNCKSEIQIVDGNVIVNDLILPMLL
jgi:DNA topoisomerase VI subunit A